VTSLTLFSCHYRTRGNRSDLFRERLINPPLADVSVSPEDEIAVHRVVFTVDCGIVVKIQTRSKRR
jgi:hypothetical protein